MKVRVSCRHRSLVVVLFPLGMRWVCRKRPTIYGDLYANPSQNPLINTFPWLRKLYDPTTIQQVGNLYGLPVRVASSVPLCVYT